MLNPNPKVMVFGGGTIGLGHESGTCFSLPYVNYHMFLCVINLLFL